MKQSGRRGFLNCCLALRLNCTIDAKILLWIQVLAVHIVQIVYIIGIPSHVHSTALISGAEVFHRNDCTHTHEVYAFILCLKESPRIRIYRFGLKIAYFAQEFYEMCFVPGFELNLIWRFVRQPKFQMQCQMIYLKTLPQLQRIAYFTPLALWWWRQQQQQHWCLLQMSRIHVVDTHTNNQCVQTHLNA